MPFYPNCKKRNVLLTTEGGLRVNLSKLHQTFSLAERSRWYRQSISYEADEYGLQPAQVEVFLRPRQKELF